MSLATGACTSLPCEVFAAGFAAGDAGAKLFAAVNFLPVEWAAEQALLCA
ncbi:hypothetical protein [Mesorhizobium sp.]|nr:hypothetical protein [Mesorhizobium sp.]